MGKNRRVTIEEIAKRADVSASTVSLALNHKGQIGQETRELIFAIAQELGYRRPSSSARLTQTIAMVVEELPVPVRSDEFFRRTLTGAEGAAARADFDILLSVIRSEESKEQYLDRFRRRQVDGILILGGGDLDDEFIGRVAQTGIPLVLVDNYVMGAEVHSVLPDNLQGGYMATEHLLKLGHRRIGMIQGPTKYKPLSERYLGYIYALRDFGIEYDPLLVPERSSHGAEKGYREMKRLLSLAEPPTAVFAVSDKTALGALTAAQDLGVRVPEDISIIGFDNLSTSEMQRPALTSVDIHVGSLGVTGVEILTKVIKGDGRNLPAKTLLAPKLVERESCRAIREEVRC